MTHGPTAIAHALLAQAAGSLRRHPKRIAAVVGTLMLCGGGGAFAVASFGPDAAELPVSQFSQTVETLPVAQQLASIAAYSFNLFRSDTTRSSDTADSLLGRLGVADRAATAFLRSDPVARQGLLGRAGRMVSVEASDDHALVRLTARWAANEDATLFQRLVVEKTPAGGFVSRTETLPTGVSSRLASATISTSLLAATYEAGIPESVANQIAEIFSGDIDFRRNLRKGDRFSVVYEMREADGEQLRAGRVLSVEFINDGTTHQAMWFQPDRARKGAYYALDGQSLNRAFLSAPVEFSRISSGFSNRFHPILQTWRAHLGTDYAAPTGTPVQSVGDGVVTFAGVQNGYGNVVFVEHANRRTTVYAHLSKINVALRQPVSQGDVIGAVGQTGWATGPHLHFEFHVGGVQQDPAVMLVRESASSTALTASTRPAFDRLAATMRIQLETANQSVASAQ